MRIIWIVVFWILFGVSVAAPFVAYLFLAEEYAAVFGLVCAIAGIAASAFLSLALSASLKSILQRVARVAKIGDIEDLIKQADDVEARKRAFEKAIDDLDKYVARESRRLFLERRAKELEQHLLTVAKDYEQLEKEAKAAEQPLDIDPDFENKVKNLLGYIRLRESLVEDAKLLAQYPWLHFWRMVIGR